MIGKGHVYCDNQSYKTELGGSEAGIEVSKWFGKFVKLGFPVAAVAVLVS